MLSVQVIAVWSKNYRISHHISVFWFSNILFKLMNSIQAASKRAYTQKKILMRSRAQVEFARLHRWQPRSWSRLSQISTVNNNVNIQHFQNIKKKLLVKSPHFITTRDVYFLYVRHALTYKRSDMFQMTFLFWIFLHWHPDRKFYFYTDIVVISFFFDFRTGCLNVNSALSLRAFEFDRLVSIDFERYGSLQ